MISAGVYGYPWDEAMDVATSTINEFLAENDKAGEMKVYLVLFRRR